MMYDHPKARDMKFNNYQLHLENARNQRLLLAMEHQAKQERKHAAMLSKFSKQWQTLDQRIEKQLQQLLDLQDKIQGNLNKMNELNHKITLVE